MLDRSLRQRDRVETRWLLAEAYVRVRDFERAIAVLEGALALRPEDPNVQHALARVLEAAGLAGED